MTASGDMRLISEISANFMWTLFKTDWRAELRQLNRHEMDCKPAERAQKAGLGTVSIEFKYWGASDGFHKSPCQVLEQDHPD